MRELLNLNLGLDLPTRLSLASTSTYLVDLRMAISNCFLRDRTPR
jgi:hypothetical protein